MAEFTSLTDSRRATLASILDEPPGVWKCELGNSVDQFARQQAVGVMAACPQHAFIALVGSHCIAELQHEHVEAWAHEGAKFAMGYHHPKRPGINRGDLPLSNMAAALTIRHPGDVAQIGDLLACPAVCHAVRFAGDCEIEIPHDKLVDPRECTCYESQYGHQQGCMFHGLKPDELREAMRKPWPTIGWVYTAPCKCDCGGVGYCSYCGKAQGRGAAATGWYDAPPAVYASLAAQCDAAGVPFWCHADARWRQLPGVVSETINLAQTDR